VSDAAAPLQTSAVSAGPGNAQGDRLAGEDVAAVDDRRTEAEGCAGRVERARAGARHDQREAAEGEAERGEATGVHALTAEGDRGARDERRERVEDEGEQRRVDPGERGEVAPGLEGVADRAEREGGDDVTPWEPAHAADAAARELERPEQRGGQGEADGQQRPDGRALAVGELAEDPHGAEGGAGGDAGDGSGRGGGHARDHGASSHQDRCVFIALIR
jgi:hypothetical protein